MGRDLSSCPSALDISLYIRKSSLLLRLFTAKNAWVLQKKFSKKYQKIGTS
jgi:hypothetical protein